MKLLSMLQIAFFYLLVFKDTNTATPFKEHFPADDGCAARNVLPDHIYMDCMGFGMGCCCLQVWWSHSQISSQDQSHSQTNTAEYLHC